MLDPDRSDRSTREFVTERAQTSTRRGRDRESGQAMVEFALILLPLMTIVAGIIWFGIGLNYWLDMQRIANQGARWAAVDNWSPQCPPTMNTCATSTVATPCATVMAPNSGARLQDVLRCSALTQGVRAADVEVCYPGKTPPTARVGDPVRVRLAVPFTFFFLERVGITLRANATMRLELRPTDANPSRVTGAANSCT
jgi:hypothetical protein